MFLYRSLLVFILLTSLFIVFVVIQAHRKHDLKSIAIFNTSFLPAAIQDLTLSLFCKLQF